MTRPAFLNVPCGKTLGHGEFCVEGHLCSSCKYISQLEAEKDKLTELANYVTAFIDIMPSHKLYDSVRCDIKRCLRQLKGGE